MHGLVKTASLLAVLAAPGAAQTITQAELLGRLLDLDRLTRPPPAGERTGLFSSYDRASHTVQDGRYVQWDANQDAGQFMGRTPDGWDVWASLDGPGAITRIWCSELAGEIRIQVDGARVAAGTLADFFRGGVEPFGEPLTYVVGGGGREAGVSYFPIGGAKSVVVQSRGFHGAYQVDTVSFPPPAQVAGFRGELDAGARKVLDEVARAFKSGLSERRIFARRGADSAGDGDSRPRSAVGNHAAQADLKPGERLTIDLPATASGARGGATQPAAPVAGTIRALYVALTDKFEPRDRYALHNLALRITFDGVAQPQVQVPLVDFFGTGFQRHRFNGLVIGTERLVEDFPGETGGESVFLYCFLPMPFRSSVRIEIENMNRTLRAPIGVMAYAKVDRTAPPADSLTFHARYRQENPCRTFDFPVLETAGPGRFVGVVLNTDCPRDAWWGEGDHKAWIDGESFPSLFGTGTADFVGNVRGLSRFVRPLHGATAVASVGKNSCFRFLTLDAIGFHRSIRLTLENWQYDRAEDVTYACVAYWYAPAGVEPANFGPLTADDLALPGLRIPGSVEVEGNIEGAGWGSVLKQRDAGVELSGEAAATITTLEPVVCVIRAAKAGRYHLRLRAVPGLSFDSVRVLAADGTPIGVVSYDRKGGPVYDVGIVELAEGENRLRVICGAKPTKLDCWILTPASP